MTTAVRRCAECGAEFTWNSRNPTRRFCTPSCRSHWWRRHRAAAPAEPPAAAERPQLGAGHECPNCGRPVTVVSLLLPADESS